MRFYNGHPKGGMPAGLSEGHRGFNIKQIERNRIRGGLVLATGYSNQLNLVGPATAFLQADPNVRWKPRHVFDPLDFASHFPMVEYGASS